MTPRSPIHFPVFSKPDFVAFRLLGPGLGNLFFPLYRAYQASAERGEVLVFPQFRQIKLGPYLRMESDKRTYGDIFLARSFNEIRLHMAALASSKQVPENELSRLSNHERVVVTYSGLANYFHDLKAAAKDGFVELLTSRAQLSERLRRDMQEISSSDIAVHYRRGDFAPAIAKAADATGMNYQVADEWYVQAVSRAKHISPKGKVKVFTDAPSVDDKFLARLQCNQIDCSANALHALLKMSKHGSLVASNSTFSLWSAYLGNQHMFSNVDFLTKSYISDEQINKDTV